MRGIEPTVPTRIYRSDNDALTLMLAAKNTQVQGKKWCRADAIRGMIRMHKQMKQRIQYLEICNGDLHREIMRLRDKIKNVYGLKVRH